MSSTLGKARTWLAVGVVVLCLTNVGKADPASDKMLADTLKEVHNKGADLYNGGDANGCYRMFEGALTTARPFLAHRADLQKAIDAAIAKAEGMSNITQRAFVLHEAIESVRDKLKGTAPAAKPEVKPEMKTEIKPMPKPEVKPEFKPEVKPLPKPEAKPEAKPATTLWDRLGSERNVVKVVDDFVGLAVADPKVDFLRGGKYKPTAVQVETLKEKLVDLVSAVSGGPRKYNGKGMKEVHAGMAITDAQFDALAGHLITALKKNGAKQDDIDAVVKAVGDTRKDIVESKKDK